MPRILSSRKARFNAALARCGMRQKDWCKKEGYHRSHLYLTLKDEKQSLRLAAKIDAFIEEVEQKAKTVAA